MHGILASAARAVLRRRRVIAPAVHRDSQRLGHRHVARLCEKTRAAPDRAASRVALTSDRKSVAVPVMPDTLDTLKELLAHQYEASLSTLYLCVARCPDANWNQPVAKWK